jgi:hypothetical protein
MDGCVIRNSRAYRIPCATVNDEAIPKGDNSALFIEPDFDLVQLITGVARAD